METYNLLVFISTIGFLTLVGVRTINKTKNEGLWNFCFFVSLGVFFFLSINGLNKSKEFSEYKNYKDMARLNPYGRQFETEFPLKFNPEISILMDSVLFDRGKTLSTSFRPSADENSLKVIEQHPRFPFGYYCLARIYYNKNDKRWINIAKQGIAIFEKTTRVVGHNVAHDECLKYLRDMIKENSTT